MFLALWLLTRLRECDLLLSSPIWIGANVALDSYLPSQNRPLNTSWKRTFSATHGSAVVRFHPASKPVVWWIVQKTSGWSLSTPGTREATRQRALPQRDELPRPVGDWMKSVPLVERGQVVRTRTAHSVRPTVFSGSAALAIAAMDDIERNCVKVSPPSLGISQRTSSRRSALCCDSMDNMVPGQRSPS